MERSPRCAYTPDLNAEKYVIHPTDCTISGAAVTVLGRIYETGEEFITHSGRFMEVIQKRRENRTGCCCLD